MRQIGILCAAALVALQDNVRKLEDDHKNAKLLAGYSFFFASIVQPTFMLGVKEKKWLRSCFRNCCPSAEMFP